MKQNIKFVYRNTDDELSHAWDAATQRQKYDAVKRHERYERDKALGKTGYKGTTARTINPYGNFASVYYNPQKAHEYYEAHKRTSGSGGNWRDRYHSKYGNKDQAAGSGGYVEGGGSGGSGGGGGSDPGLANDLAKLRDAGAKEKEQLRKEAKDKISKLQAETNAKAEEVRKLIEEGRVQGKKERDDKREEVNADIEKEKGKSKKDIEAEEKQLKRKRDAQNDPLKRENASIRGRLESMSKTANPRERARLQRMLAVNNDKISKANAEFTDSLTLTKTKHNVEMRNAITQLRVDLKNFTLQSSAKQKANALQWRNELKTLRKKNQNEIKIIRQKLKLDLLQSTKSTQDKINQRRGKASDTSKLDAQINQAQKDYEHMGGNTVSRSASFKRGQSASGILSSRSSSGSSSGSSRSNSSRWHSKKFT